VTRLLVTGAEGQVGWELCRTLSCLGEVIACSRATLDLGNVSQLRETVQRVQPAAIVNAAAYTAVDKAESDQALARSINADAPRIFAEEAARLGAWLVHYSTDYVFDGTKSAPYVESDAPNPANVYGRTKLDGELGIAAVGGRHLIFRTSWVYASRGKNFVRTMLKLGAERDELRVVDDQRGAPTWARLIAEATALALARVMSDGARDGAYSGVYHLTSSGVTSWRGFADAIFEQHGASRRPRVVPITTAQYPTPARRPLNSSLSNEKLARAFGIRLPAWDKALAMCMEELRAGGGA